MPYVTLFSEITCAPENADAVARRLAEFTLETRAEPGCLAFELAQHPREPHRFALYEVFADQTAFDAHAAAPHVKAIFEFMQKNEAQAKHDFWNMLSRFRLGK